MSHTDNRRTSRWNARHRDVDRRSTANVDRSALFGREGAGKRARGSPPT